MPASNPSRLFLSGNEAVARAVWESGCKVAAAYPGTPSTEMLEVISTYPEIYSEWSVNEKVALEVAIGAAFAGSRAFCAMKHVGMNVASDALMTLTLTGVIGGLVIAIADDVGLSSSQNEQDSRFWGRFAHLPVFEPADSQEAYEMTKLAFDFSEQHQVPVILRMTTRINHVKGLVSVGTRAEHPNLGGFKKDPARWVMTPAGAGRRIPLMFERDVALAAAAEVSPLNSVESGRDRRVGFVASGPTYMHVKESFPDAPVLKLGFSCPVPVEKIRTFAATVDKLIVVEEVEPLVEKELKAAGIACHGKDLLPKQGELAPNVLRPAIAKLLGEPAPEHLAPPAPVFPRPPTMCVACPHLGVYYTLSQIKNITISGDIGCYTLGAGHPWNALDTTISMGASMGIALGLDKGRGEADKDKRILAVIGDSTFLHMGMQGLLDIVYNRGNVTVLLLDNRAVGMTGGQPDPGSGRDIHGEPAPRVDFAKLVEALGVKKERIHVVDPYQLPVLFKAIREEIKIPEVSVIITDQPCVLIDDYKKQKPYEVLDAKCTGCGNCIEVGCPAIHVVRREKAIKPSGKEVELQFVRIETSVCTGCGLCVQPCAPDAIVPADPSKPIRLVKH
ncbi:thiamine pyrophosphate-dependent enzyme [Sulfuricystis multivorans]|uniref:thiamine pyrophosphate-dependent enzyme n=1 Tax=Sulfuricystis multivorans TaxID=2211108 RepID=UPI0024DF3301|nr:thiamine pyrophosphate-dependent enzyme [Sulfuricystis multivorans]